MGKPNVVIADSNPAERALLRFYLAGADTPCSLVDPGAGAEAIAALSPQVVLLEGDSTTRTQQLCTRLRELKPGVAVVVIADAARPTLVTSARSPSGPDAVLLRPLTLDRLEAVLGPVLEPPGEPARKRVLVIDDDPDVLHLAETVLTQDGCEVTVCQDARQLLRKPRLPEYDLALIDVVMPEVDGLQVCLKLREQCGDDLRICMITAAHDPETVRKAELYGADGFLTKPIHLHELLALVGHARLFPGSGRAGGRPPLSGARPVSVPPAETPQPVTPAPESTEAPAPVAKAPPAVAPGKERVHPPPPAPGSEHEEGAGTGPKRQPHVLVIDDDKDILDWCRAVFTKAGAIVDSIQDPTSLRDTLPPGGTYDLVLLDIFMPAIDGIELLRRFSADVRNMASRFYVITAEEDPALRQLARQSGADGYLTKPLKPEQVLSLLQAA
jgi:DNA-binding response OmpR family regulator